MPEGAYFMMFIFWVNPVSFLSLLWNKIHLEHFMTLFHIVNLWWHMALKCDIRYQMCCMYLLHIALYMGKIELDEDGCDDFVLHKDVFVMWVECCGRRFMWIYMYFVYYTYIQIQNSFISLIVAVSHIHIADYVHVLCWSRQRSNADCTRP